MTQSAGNNVKEAERLLAAEFAELRRGWGVAASALGERVGVNLARLAGVPAEAGNQEVRRRVLALVERLLRGSSEEDRLAVRVALGIDPDARLSQLTARTQELAGRLHCSERGARRKIARAFALMAQVGAAELGAPYDPEADPDVGWYVRRFEAILRLDRESPEVTEQRTIVARWDGLRRISARFSVPKRGETPLALAELHTETHFGARIKSREQQSDSHFRFILDLPRPLRRDEEHDYEIVFRLPPGWPMIPHYAFVPLITCESFRLRVRFDPACPPAALWRLDGLAQRALDGRKTPGEPFRLDAHGEATLRFDRLEQGYAYGIEWLPHQCGEASSGSCGHSAA
jgi:hypothetical protein